MAEKLKLYRDRLQALKTEQSSWRTQWLDLAEQIQPTRARLLSNEANRGQNLHGKIINGTPLWASDVEAAGMQAGLSSEARPWFRLATPDPELSEVGEVRVWLNVVAERIRYALSRGGIYRSLYELYLDLVVFGTGCLYVEKNHDRLLRATTFPVGSFYLGNGPDGRVDTVYREFSMTVGNMAKDFGLEKCSSHVKAMHRENKLDTWIELCLVIEPNKKYQEGKLGPIGKPFGACYFEVAGDEDGESLREEGYEEFPCMAPRWATTDPDVYGRSPGMAALGDCKALQLLEKRKAQAVEKTVSPPMGAPSNVRQTGGISLLPAGTTYFDSLGAGQKVGPIMEIQPAAIVAAGQEIQNHQERINKAFAANLWLMLSAGENSPQKTAREVSELHEEKMLQLGPVVGRLGGELHDPLINRVFGILLREGYLPEPPEELQGIELRVELVSVMAQAQKLLGITGVNQILSIAGNISAVKPEVLDKVDFDQAIDILGDMLGTPPDLIRSDEAVEKIRAQRAKAAQQQQAMEQAMAVTQGAKTLSETDMEGDSALNRLLGNLGGPASVA